MAKERLLDAELNLTFREYFEILDLVNKICSIFSIEYIAIFKDNEEVTNLFKAVTSLKEKNDPIFLKYKDIISSHYSCNLEEDVTVFENFLKLLFYPALILNKDTRNFNISSYDLRIDLYRNRVLDYLEERNKECTRSRTDWYISEWWRIFVFKSLRESGVSQEWIFNSTINEVISEWIAIQDYSELRAAIDFDDRVERDMEYELNKPITVTLANGKTQEQKPVNLKLQKKLYRKKFYKQ